MSKIVINRVSSSSYQLEINGGVVATYDQTQMTHPWDWSEDAKANGASDREIEMRDYEYVDSR